MTINRLIKELQKLEQIHGKRIKVLCAAKDMYEGSNQVFTHLEVGTVSIECINQCDGDGFTEKHDVPRVVLS